MRNLIFIFFIMIFISSCTKEENIEDFFITHISTNPTEITEFQENIQVSNDNKTRFLVIGKNIEDKSENNKTSVMINIADKPGSLMSILKPFTELNINMTRIETRPSRNNQYLHTFFIDFEGYYEDAIVIELLEKLENMSEELRVIGSYAVLN